MKTNDTKEDGIMHLPDDMPLREKQAAGAKHTHATRKKTTIEAILQAATSLKAEGNKILQKTVAFQAGVSKATVGVYWQEVKNHLGLD
jgi:hypothetical protein